MITKGELKNWSVCEIKEKAYFRPLVCKGELSKADIFLVGINPATPIMQKDLNIDDYISLLCDYDKFIVFYKKARVLSGKSEFSRTRTGMNSFLSWLSGITTSSVVETNIFTYPTENIKKLWKEPTEIIERGKNTFFEIMMKIRPKLIILHGKETVEQFIDGLSHLGIEFNNAISFDKTINEMEAAVPLLTFNYSKGSTCVVAVCRHFMYYGEKGNSYANFKEKIKRLVS